MKSADNSATLGVTAISEGQASADGASHSRLDVIFAPGTRPDVASLATIGSAGASSDLPGFAISHSSPERDWAEIVVAGMTFDCIGLAPGAPSATPPPGMGVGLPTLPEGECVTVVPGAHLGGSAALLPVLRMQVTAGARLAASKGAAAVVWRAGGSWIEPGLFAQAAGEWLAGGAYPALCLTALEPTAGGGLRTRGVDARHRPGTDNRSHHR